MLGESDEDELEFAKELADALPNGYEIGIARTLLRSLDQLAIMAVTCYALPLPSHLCRSRPGSSPPCWRKPTTLTVGTRCIGQARDLNRRRRCHWPLEPSRNKRGSGRCMW
jgi:hypothetical protein